MKAAVSIAAALVAWALAVPLTRAFGGSQVFRGGVDAVRVDVLVTDGTRPVPGLTAADFELRDSGVPQRILSVTIDDVPVSMLMALDTSTSVEGPTLSHLKWAVHLAVDSLGPQGRTALLTFSNAVALDADWGSSGRDVDGAAARVQAAGTMSLYDAAFAALTMKDPMPTRRGLIVLFSDGEDTSSWLPRRAGLEKASRTDVVVYSVIRRQLDREAIMHYRSGVEPWRSAPPAGFSSDPFVKELADLTGGSMFVADSTDSLRTAFQRIVTEFRNRYVLTYTPDGVAPGGWHPLDVRLKSRRMTLKARRGYFRDSL